MQFISRLASVSSRWRRFLKNVVGMLERYHRLQFNEDRHHNQIQEQEKQIGEQEKRIHSLERKVCELNEKAYKPDLRGILNLFRTKGNLILFYSICTE